MKKCIYCESEVTDDVTQCENCGSKELKNICINCGAEFDDMKCPACGIMVGEKPRTCFHCGKKTFEKICPECGADLINKRRVQVSTYSIPEPILNPQPLKPNPQFNLQPKPKKKRIVTKIILGVVAVWMIGLFVVTGVILYNISKMTPINSLTEFKVATTAEHPRFYGDVDEAREMWENYRNIVVRDTGRSSTTKDTLLLVTGSESDNNSITRISIDLSNLDDKRDITLETVLELTSGYIPYDILDQYYIFEEAFREVYKAGGYEAYIYVMKINADGEAVNELGEKHYNNKFAFKIIRRNDNDWSVSMDILSDKGNYKSTTRDVYDVENWDVDIYKYR